MNNCARCGPRPFDFFRPDKKGKNGLYAYCKDCESKYRRAWYKKNKAKVKSTNANWYKKNFDRLRSEGLEKRYGVTQAEYDRMFKEQGGCCAICKLPQGALKKTLSVDHNHKTGYVRGLLCQTCNVGVGALKIDSGSALLLKAVEYVILKTIEYVKVSNE